MTALISFIIPGNVLHCDQGLVPLPWGDKALNANCTWALTDYTPRSHSEFGPLQPSHVCPVLIDAGVIPDRLHPDAAQEAIPVECPRGSLIAFHGALWHGAYPKSTPGLRVTIANYFRHFSILPQADIPNHFPKELADDCVDPETFKELAGFGIPYQSADRRFPRAVRAGP